MHSALAATRLWVERVVIGLSLCPWARPVHERDALRFVHVEAATSDALLDCFVQEVDLLSMPTPRHETTLIVAPNAFMNDFVGFYEFVQIDCQEHLQQRNLDESFQVVSFHPLFTFAGESSEDVSNFVNRSPFTTLHILRQTAVNEAIEAAPQIAEELPSVNLERMHRLGAAKMLRLLSGALEDGLTDPSGSCDSVRCERTEREGR